MPTLRIPTTMRFSHYVRHLVLLPLIYVFLAGCQPRVYLMPTPVGLQSGKHDPFMTTSEKYKGNQISIAYGTNRLPSDEGHHYAREFDENLRMGVARVQIGDGNQSWEEIRELSIHRLDKKDSLLKISEVNQIEVLHRDDSVDKITPELQSMFNKLNAVIDESPVKEITIYVHGANNNFYRTAAQAAQYRHFTGRQALVILFSWPSAESIFRYGTDISNIMETVPTFARYIKLLAKYSNAKRINILCYSAGATLTTKTLAMLGSDMTQADREEYRKSLRLGSIYFAAPDTDFDDFVEEYRLYQDIVNDVTVTINQNDMVLGISQSMFHATGGPKKNSQQVMSSKSRLGRPDTKDLTPAQADWIISQTHKPNFDVLAVDYKAIPGLSKGSHDYWYQNPWGSSDTLLTLNFHSSPAERGLISLVTERNAKIWYFPTDYDERIDETIDKIVEQYLAEDK